MDKRRKASILIEDIAAIPIVIISIIISARLYIAMSKNVDNEYINYKNKESLNAICNEVKYNVEFDYLVSSLKNKNILIQYDKDFLDTLIEKKFEDLNSNYSGENRIEIKMLDERASSLKIEVLLYYNSNVFKEEIKKGRWMDYV
ncbi:MAG: hypothetical protein E7213_02560 [Clostridium sp.]|nr:hypothetical protein [Clostridium sp.]